MIGANRDARGKSEAYPNNDVVDTCIHVFACFLLDITEAATQYWAPIRDTQAVDYRVEDNSNVRVPISPRMFQERTTVKLNCSTGGRRHAG